MAERLKKVLVVYATVSGCTTTIAHRIADDIIAFAARPTVASVEDLPQITHDYDAVVFGSGMRMGKWHKDARIWLQNNFDYLSTIPVACYSVGLLSANGQANSDAQAKKDLESAVASFGNLKPVGMVALPGWKRSDGFSTMERIALKVYPLEDGDYRDWDKVDRWVSQVAPKMLGTQAQYGTSYGASVR